MIYSGHPVSRSTRLCVVTLLPGLMILGLWELSVHGVARLEFLFASPSKIAAVAQQEVLAGTILIDLSVTAIEAIVGLLVGSLVGSLIGLLMWADDRIARVARPYIVIVGAIPIFAIAPMLIIWFGTGTLSKVVMSAFSVFFVALGQAYDGARFCSREYTQYALTLNAPRLRMLKKIIVPGALRWVAAGFKINIGLALVGAFIGEFVSSEAGLGHYILSAGGLYDMPRVMFGVLLISLLALSMTALVWACELWKPNLFARSE
ncbi:MAG: hypothetical protein RIS36_1854 [Pseudomonadota bacterium]